MCRELATRAIATTAGYWNTRGEPHRAAVGAAAGLLEALAGSDVDCYLSLKASALGFSTELASEVAGRAREGGHRVLFDSLAPEEADRTLALLEQLPVEGAGCALPARWQRSLDDAERAVERGWRVRIVKGQWPDPRSDRDAREGFLALVDALAGRVPHVAVATHDTALAEQSLRRLTEAGTSAEHELLWGLPFRPVGGATVRVYVPYGHGFLPYGLRQAVRRPRILLWVARDALRGGR